MHPWVAKTRTGGLGMLETDCAVRRSVLLGAGLVMSMAAVGPAGAQSGDTGPRAGLPEPIAELRARLAYSSDAGAVVGAGVTARRLFGRDQTLAFDVEAGRDALSYALDYRAPGLFGEAPAFGIAVNATRSEDGEVFDFDSESLSVRPELVWPRAEGEVTAYLDLSRAEITDVPADASALIAQDDGTRRRAALGVRLDGARAATGEGPFAGLRYGVGLEAGGTDEEHRFVGLSGRTAARWTFGATRARIVTLEFRGGAIETTDGVSNIGDRYVLGSTAIRGFAYGGFGPRDLAARGEPALGGNYYALVRADFQIEDAIPQAPALTPGVFVDAGSLWGLDDTAGGPGGTAAVDDDAHLRVSVGVSLEIDTGVGPISLSYAEPIEDRSYDEVQEVQVSFRRSF